MCAVSLHQLPVIPGGDNIDHHLAGVNTGTDNKVPQKSRVLTGHVWLHAIFKRKTTTQPKHGVHLLGCQMTAGGINNLFKIAWGMKTKSKIFWLQ